MRNPSEPPDASEAPAFAELLEPGEVAGDYQIVSQIGRGGMGIVYRARQLSLDREVALKALPLLAALDERRLERFERECQVLARLSHRSIVPVYDAGQIAGTVYYAMQFIPGCGLDRRLAAGEPLAVEELVGIGAAVAEALQHAHSRDVIHRDVKPGNILLHEDGRVFLTDFGLARLQAEGSITAPSEVLGTPHYMCPEQAMGARHPLDARSDVYSLGVVLYEMATGNRPFEGCDTPAFLEALLRRDPPPPRARRTRIHRDLETIILKAMAFEPRARYEEAQLVAEDLQAFLAHRPIQARREGLPRRAWRWVRRHRTPSLLGALLLVLLPLLLVLEVQRQRQAGELAAAEARERRALAAQHLLGAWELLQPCCADPARAASLLEEALELDPQREEAPLLHRFAAGTLRAEDLPDRHRSSTEWWLAARLAEQRGEHSEALATLSAGIERDPTSAQLLHLQLFLLEALGRRQEAILVANTCVHLAPGRAWPRAHLAALRAGEALRAPAEGGTRDE